MGKHLNSAVSGFEKVAYIYDGSDASFPGNECSPDSPFLPCSFHFFRTVFQILRQRCDGFLSRL